MQLGKPHILFLIECIKFAQLELFQRVSQNGVWQKLQRAEQKWWGWHPSKEKAWYGDIMKYRSGVSILSKNLVFYIGSYER